MDQSKEVKRLAKKGAVSSTMKWVGSNQATNCSRPVSGVFADFAKADEGFHFVAVAGDFFGERFEAAGEEVGGDAEKILFAIVDAVDGFVEKGPAFGFAMAGDEVGEFEESFWGADFSEVAGVVVGLVFLDGKE